MKLHSCFYDKCIKQSNDKEPSDQLINLSNNINICYRFKLNSAGNKLNNVNVVERIVSVGQVSEISSRQLCH